MEIGETGAWINSQGLLERREGEICRERGEGQPPCERMSDLCSPMIMLLEDEAAAFWCFERLMKRLGGNFKCTDRSVGVESQLSNLASVTRVIDPKLHQRIDHLGGGDYFLPSGCLWFYFSGSSPSVILSTSGSLFWMYEETDSWDEMAEGSKLGKPKSTRQCGKYERENMKNAGKSTEAPLPTSILNDVTGNLEQKGRAPVP
ncbi:hypothetical protein SAY87_003179 [Trapa incisa]|uniref:Rab-GAP TBC domain-containing protein n=1 Tax=Trapa incisa TaxID=236973 RepID=A0AAN7KNR7_9MYRT|nr:hypothetical protein SAY87_003179 [Trapa incisa]